jgi:hypothetical protein
MPIVCEARADEEDNRHASNGSAPPRLRCITALVAVGISVIREFALYPVRLAQGDELAVYTRAVSR